MGADGDCERMIAVSPPRRPEQSLKLSHAAPWRFPSATVCCRRGEAIRDTLMSRDVALAEKIRVLAKGVDGLEPFAAAQSR